MESIYQKVWQDPYIRNYLLKFIVHKRCKICKYKLTENDMIYYYSKKEYCIWCAG